MADQNQAQAQPIDPGVQAFQNLRVEVANIGQALAAQGVSGTISKFERQLIDIFVDGLTNDQLKMKILRDQPDCHTTGSCRHGHE